MSILREIFGPQATTAALVLLAAIAVALYIATRSWRKP